ncbi:MAG TPA: hypothetical protein VG055_18040 [Planctomycetaceae bacterium]|jgi:hypothetical protein|nr:hypothetical protein [Planctomycetaceae bacterium]
MDSPPLAIPSPESHDVKEVFAFFGLAAYHAQVFEQAALHLVAALEVFSLSSSSARTVDSVYGEIEKQTLGQLLNAARRVVAIDPTIDNLLSDALRERNELVHRFFEQNSENFIVESGRKAMIDRLRGVTDLFQRADRAASDLFWPISTAMGVTEEVVNRTFDRMIRDAQTREAALASAQS